MISNLVGNVLKKNTKTRIWWMKLAIAIVISNVFFFLLFSGNETPAATNTLPTGWVELQVRAELLTTFHKGKKILLVNRTHAKKVEGMLQDISEEPEARHTILVKEDEAQILLKYQQWEILPFIKTLQLTSKVTGDQHEIRY